MESIVLRGFEERNARNFLYKNVALADDSDRYILSSLVIFTWFTDMGIGIFDRMGCCSIHRLVDQQASCVAKGKAQQRTGHLPEIAFAKDMVVLRKPCDRRRQLAATG
jgi:hypothetical protein